MSSIRKALDFIETAEGVASMDEMEAALQPVLADFGVRHYTLLAMTRRPNNSARTPQVLTKGSDPDWSAYYRDSGFFNCDAAVHWALQRPDPFTWEEVEGRRLSRPAQALFAETRAHMGVDGGLVLPLHDTHGFAGLVAFFHEQRRLAPDVRKALRLIGLYASERARELCDLGAENGVDDVVCPLTDRQREALAYAAMGKSDWDVAQILGLSEKTVNHHFERAKKTLGVKTRAQAVAIAVHRGWLAI